MPLRWIDQVPWATLRVRLTVWNTAVVLLMTLATLLAVRVGARAALFREADSVLRGEVTEVALALEALSPDTAAVVATLGRKAVSHEDRGWFTHLLTEDGKTIWRSDHCPDVVANYPPSRKDQEENVVQVKDYRYVRRRIAGREGEPVHVRIGMSTLTLDAGVNALMRLLIPVGGLLLLLTPLAGYWLAVRATKPVAQILRTAERLRPTRLGDRLNVRGTQDELDQLSVTINHLLDQVADHVDRQQQFVADAAHELRGPLAAVRSSLEVAISQERTADEYHETVADVLDEIRHLAKLANDLLLLAETGNDLPAPERQPVDLTRVATQAAAMFAGVAEEQGIGVVIRPSEPLLVAGDAAQLRQVLGNLLDNAIRFTPPGGEIVLACSRDHATGEIVMSVTDTGPGIAPEHKARVFDRFYKVDPARSRSPHGRSGGLGLSICRSIVERHGGTIAIASELGSGTAVTVRLPEAGRPAAPSPAAAPSLASQPSLASPAG